MLRTATSSPSHWPPASSTSGTSKKSALPERRQRYFSPPSPLQYPSSNHFSTGPLPKPIRNSRRSQHLPRKTRIQLRPARARKLSRKPPVLHNLHRLIRPGIPARSSRSGSRVGAQSCDVWRWISSEYVGARERTVLWRVAFSGSGGVAGDGGY